MAAWNNCYILMLKTVFANNPAEQQKFYLTLLRLSPSKQKVSAFLQHFTTLAGYVAELPSLIHSCDATDAKKAVEPYGDGKLAMIALYVMPYTAGVRSMTSVIKPPKMWSISKMPLRKSRLHSRLVGVMEAPRTMQRGAKCLL
jgi:hypothetical protein